MNVRSLEQRIRNLEGDDGLAQRRRVSMALVVVGQMLPGGVIKGGSAMALRYGRGTRFTQDLDAARVQTLARFRSDFEDALAEGWAGFTGRLIGDADKAELQLADDMAVLFTQVGLEAPKPVPVMRADHQVAQKLHAVSGESSERARDLADLQLLDKRENLDLGQVAATCVRLFDYRRQQAWPPSIVVGEQWDTLYAEAVEGLDVLPTVEEAVVWANDFVQRVAAAS